MIAPKHNSSCGEAKLYYYDFLHDESRELIPESILNHIEQCQHCQEQIDQYKVVLSQAEGIEPEHGQVNFAVTTMLKLHFAYIGKPVTCKTVRPFLPGLLDPALGVRIPTPITAHLDNCQKCREDIDIILEAEEDRFADQIVAGQAQVDSGQHWINFEGQETQDPGRDEEQPQTQVSSFVRRHLGSCAR